MKTLKLRAKIHDLLPMCSEFKIEELNEYERNIFNYEKDRIKIIEIYLFIRFIMKDVYIDSYIFPILAMTFAPYLIMKSISVNNDIKNKCEIKKYIEQFCATDKYSLRLTLKTIEIAKSIDSFLNKKFRLNSICNNKNNDNNDKYCKKKRTDTLNDNLDKSHEYLFLDREIKSRHFFNKIKKDIKFKKKIYSIFEYISIIRLDSKKYDCCEKCLFDFTLDDFINNYEEISKFDFKCNSTRCKTIEYLMCQYVYINSHKNEYTKNNKQFYEKNSVAIDNIIKLDKIFCMSFPDLIYPSFSYRTINMFFDTYKKFDYNIEYLFMKIEELYKYSDLFSIPEIYNETKDDRKIFGNNLVTVINFNHIGGNDIQEDSIISQENEYEQEDKKNKSVDVEIKDNIKKTTKKFFNPYCNNHEGNVFGFLIWDEINRSCNDYNNLSDAIRKVFVELLETEWFKTTKIFKRCTDNCLSCQETDIYSSKYTYSDVIDSMRDDYYRVYYYIQKMKITSTRHVLNKEKIQNEK